MIPALLWTGIAGAQGFRPPAFVDGIPGQIQMQSIAVQRHQTRTLLYREAIKELMPLSPTSRVNWGCKSSA